MNVCEHGDHAAPEGQRFCSEACKLCEATECDESQECAGLCKACARAVIVFHGPLVIDVQASNADIHFWRGVRRIERVVFTDCRLFGPGGKQVSGLAELSRELAG